MDNSVELLSQLNKSLAAGEISLADYSTKTKHIAAIRAQREEDKKRAKAVFEKYDKDKSGALDANEFAALAFSLGGNFSKEEIDAAIKQLDTDGGGTVDFDEFYTWWSNPENHGAKASKLSGMRLALTTQHLKERTSAIAKSMNDALAKGKGSNDSQNFNVDLSVGKFETASGLYIDYEVNESAADGVAKEFGCTTRDMLLSIAFTAAHGKEAFDLGVLSGKVKDLLALQQEIQFKSVNNDVKEIDGHVLFRINLVMDGNDPLLSDTVKAITQNMLQTLSFALEVNETIGEPFEEASLLRLKFGMKLAKGGEFIKEILSDVGALPAFLPPPDSIFGKVRDFSLSVVTDSLAEMAEKVIGSPLPVKNLFSGREIVGEAISGIFASDLPDTLLDTYKLITDNLLGFHSITVAANNAVMRLRGEKINFVKLLPSSDEIDALVQTRKAELDDAPFGDDSAEADDGGDAEEEAATGARPKVPKGRKIYPALSTFSLKDDAALKGSFALGTDELLLSLDPGHKVVDDAESQFGKVLQLVASKQLLHQATIESVPNGEYQAMMRVKVAPHASLGVVDISINRLDTYDTLLELKWKPATDPLFGASWYEVRLGEPFTIKGSKPNVMLDIKTPDSNKKMLNGLVADYFALVPIDRANPPPAADEAPRSALPIAEEVPVEEATAPPLDELLAEHGVSEDAIQNEVERCLALINAGSASADALAPAKPAEPAEKAVADEEDGAAAAAATEEANAAAEKEAADAEAKRAAEAAEAEAQAAREAEEAAAREAEETAAREAETAAAVAREAEEAAAREAAAAAKEAEEQAKKDAEAKAKKDAEEKAKREADEKAKREAEAAAEAKRTADAKAAEEKAKKEADEKAKREAAAKQAADAKAKKDAEEKAKKDADAAAAAAAAAAPILDPIAAAAKKEEERLARTLGKKAAAPAVGGLATPAKPAAPALASPKAAAAPAVAERSLPPPVGTAPGSPVVGKLPSVTSPALASPLKTAATPTATTARSLPAMATPTAVKPAGATTGFAPVSPAQATPAGTAPPSPRAMPKATTAPVSAAAASTAKAAAAKSPTPGSPGPTAAVHSPVPGITSKTPGLPSPVASPKVSPPITTGPPTGLPPSPVTAPMVGVKPSATVPAKPAPPATVPAAKVPSPVPPAAVPKTTPGPVPPAIVPAKAPASPVPPATVPAAKIGVPVPAATVPAKAPASPLTSKPAATSSLPPPPGSVGKAPGTPPVGAAKSPALPAPPAGVKPAAPKVAPPKAPAT